MLRAKQQPSIHVPGAVKPSLPTYPVTVSRPCTELRSERPKSIRQTCGSSMSLLLSVSQLARSVTAALPGDGAASRNTILSGLTSLQLRNGAECSQSR